ncbi:Conserved oligomeric Golgi complex subunit 8 [Leucoagaricus sp. SymC.cos]|nr:Conserved oligomeric Golgi complex subunit 8 [Leucoagaricus sp. SymC.cos]
MDEIPTIVASPLADVAPLVDVLSESSLSELNTPGSKGYLSHLATLPLAELTQEPITLQTQSHHLTSSLTSFTHTSYPTFISLHKNTSSFTSSIESLSSSLEDLLNTSLPTLEESTGIWKGRTESVLRERNKARVVLEQHEKIRDLLDIPVLIDTCVRNGYFGEALSLANHVTSLVHRADDKKDKHPPAILTSVLAEVQYSITQMHLSLLATLYEPNRKLPALWKAVNFLRKMDAFATDSTSPLGLKDLKAQSREVPTRSRLPDPSSEEQLALAFLIGREACLKTTLESTGRDIRRLVKQVGDELDERDREDLARYLKKYIDAWREGVYDVMTQYTTIFLERSPAHSEQTHSADNDEHLFSRLHTLLRTYSTRALSTHLLAILKPSLPLLTLYHLPSLLTQLNYCSTAFSRLGLDFCCILTSGGGLFSDTILSIVRRDFEGALEKWASRVGKARGTTAKSASRTTSASSSRASAGPAELPSKWLVSPSVVDSPPLPPPRQGTGPAHIPPQLLASYPPLAQLTNAVLGVLNGLRLVVPHNTSAVNGAGNSTETSMSAEGVYALLELLDDIILDQGSAGLLAYLQLVIKSLGGEEHEAGGEKQKAKEMEERIVVATGRAFFDVFAVFVRRALVEGVYGIKMVGNENGRGRVKGEEDEIVASWLDRRKEFDKIILLLKISGKHIFQDFFGNNFFIFVIFEFLSVLVTQITLRDV